MISSVFVYLGGNESDLKQDYLDDFVDDRKCREFVGFLVDPACPSAESKVESKVTEPFLRRLPLLGGALVNMSGYTDSSNEALLSLRAAFCSRTITQVGVVAEKAGTARMPNAETLKHKEWMRKVVTPFVSYRRKRQAALERRRDEIEKHSQVILKRALIKGWEPLRGSALKPDTKTKLTKEIDRLAENAAATLINEFPAVTLSSLYDAAAFVFCNEDDETVLSEVALAARNLFEIAKVLHEPEIEDHTELPEAVRTRTLALKMAPEWRQDSCIGSPGKRGVVVLADTDADVARLLIRAVASAKVKLGDETGDLRPETHNNGGYDELVVKTAPSLTLDERPYLARKAEEVIDALSSSDELRGHGFVLVCLEKSQHIKVRDAVSEFDVVCFDPSKAESAIDANQRHNAYFHENA